ncbi:hypothetical protein [Flavobacterium sp.]|uniref:hypothetical protein n=1 Tax=Flavobacterium sp. TaxID=239 RepID=UPI0037538D53
MKIFKKLLDFYINSSIHVAIAVFCLLQITTISNNLHPINCFSTTVFFGTIIGYNFLKYFDVFRKKRFDKKNYFQIFVVTFLALIGFSISFFSLKFDIQKYIFISGLFVLVYPFLRKYGWLKLLLVSFVVTFITVFIPYQIEDLSTSNFTINLILRFIIVVSLLIPFEILDSKIDSISMNTLPQKFGTAKTKLLGYCFLFFYSILQFYFFKFNFEIVISIFIVFLIGFSIYFSDTKRNKFYTSLWVESIPIFWWILLLIFS